MMIRRVNNDKPQPIETEYWKVVDGFSEIEEKEEALKIEQAGLSQRFEILRVQKRRFESEMEHYSRLLKELNVNLEAKTATAAEPEPDNYW